jgi:hypothetical protein
VDYSFFALGLVGALVGYIVGDFQRQSRYRRDARANLALANQRAADRANQRANRARNLGTVADSGTNGHGDDDGGTFALNRVRHGQARRRAIPRDHNGTRSGAHAAGSDPRGTNETPLAVAS